MHVLALKNGETFCPMNLGDALELIGDQLGYGLQEYLEAQISEKEEAYQALEEDYRTLESNYEDAIQDLDEEEEDIDCCHSRELPEELELLDKIRKYIEPLRSFNTHNLYLEELKELVR